MKKITVWQRLLHGRWQHNHIASGWGVEAVPAAAFENQIRAWRGAVWRKGRAWLIGGKVVRP